MPRSRLTTLLGLAVSAAALTTLVHLEIASAHEAVTLPEVAVDDEGDGIEALVPRARRVIPAQTVAASVAPEPFALAAASPPPAALVAVPDLEGMSFRSAKRALKKVGLKMKARDRRGQRVPRFAWSGHKVRSQSLAAGEQVEPGTRVELKSRRRMRVAKGY